MVGHQPVRPHQLELLLGRQALLGIQLLWTHKELRWLQEALMTQYLIQLSDPESRHMVVLTLRQFDVKKAAVEVVFDVLGAEADELIAANILSAGQSDDLKELQTIIFAHDDQGGYIREDVSFSANGRP